MTEAEQGSHSELGKLRSAKSPIPEMGGTPIDRPFYRSRQHLLLVKLRYGILRLL